MKTREIKFRGWHTGANKMFSAEEMAGDQLTLLPTGSFINVNGASTMLSTIYSREKFIPLQFTGLHDKAGKEIYEWDIVKYILPGETFADATTEYVEAVSFIDGCFVVDGFTPVYATADWGVEVIGDIYENASLLIVSSNNP